LSLRRAVIGLDEDSVWGTLAERNGGGARPGGNGTGRGSQARRVVVVSNESSVLSLFEAAMGIGDSLVAATGEDELRAALASKAETVVLDLPAGERVEAWERVRTLHAGMVLIAVDSQAETEEWPPDLARRFLVRPLDADDIAAALAVRPMILREPAAARRRRLDQGRRPPLVPPPALPPDRTPAAIEPARRLSSGESLWEQPGEPDQRPATPSPGPGQARPDARARGRVGLLVGAMVLLLVATAVGGIAFGRATANPDRIVRDVARSSIPTPSTPASGAPIVVVREKTPAACDAALSDADAAVSYLVGNIRDQRLSQSMQRYQQNRRACREASR
jgi:hypothetical protein